MKQIAAKTALSILASLGLAFSANAAEIFLYAGAGLKIRSKKSYNNSNNKAAIKSLLNMVVPGSC